MAEVKQLRFPHGDDVTHCHVKFKLHGQHIYDVEITDSSFNWASTKHRSMLLSDIGRAIAKDNNKGGKSSWSDLDIKYIFAPIALRQSPTDADAQLGGCGLVLVDFSRLAGHDPSCPRCGASNSPDGSKRVIEDKSWSDRARKMDGAGHVHTWYILSKKRCCLQCKDKAEQGAAETPSAGKNKGKGNFLDTQREVLDQLPAAIQQLIPGTCVELSGMSTFLRELMTCLSQWVPPGLLAAFTEARNKQNDTASEDREEEEEEQEEQEESAVEDAAHVLMDLADKPSSHHHNSHKRKFNVLLEKEAPPVVPLAKPSSTHKKLSRDAVLYSHVARQAARTENKSVAPAASGEEEEECGDHGRGSRHRTTEHSIPATDYINEVQKRRRINACKLCAFHDGIAVKMVGHECPHKEGKTRAEVAAMMDALPKKDKFSSKEYLKRQGKPIPDWM